MVMHDGTSRSHCLIVGTCTPFVRATYGAISPAFSPKVIRFTYRMPDTQRTQTILSRDSRAQMHRSLTYHWHRLATSRFRIGLTPSFARSSVLWVVAIVLAVYLATYVAYVCGIDAGCENDEAED